MPFLNSRTNKLRLNKYTIALTASTAMITSASAATIVWGEFDLDAKASEISTNGTLVEALNLVSNNNLLTNTTTINGVTFTATNLFRENYPDDGLGPSTGNAALDLLFLQSGYQYDTTPITLMSLTIGTEYELQTFLGEDGLYMNVGSGLMIQKTSLETTDNGAWIIGTFTADATTQNFHSSYDMFFENNLAGYQLRDISSVPEPSSTALIGLGALALILRRSK